MAKTIRMTNEDRDKKVSILEECWLKGCSDEEACLIAGIDRVTLNRWLFDKENKGLLVEGLAEIRELSKKNPTYIARTNVYKSLKKGNVDTSKWYLEHKASDEFSTRVQSDAEINVSSKTIEEKEQEMLSKLDALIKK